MMWHHLSRQPKWIDTVYGDTPPTLRTCRLSEVHFTDNNDMILTLHIDEMPPEHLWPGRWDKGYNRVALTLVLSGIHAVRIEGWSANNVANIEIRRADDGQFIVLTASGAWGCITVTCGWLGIRTLKGYRAEEGAHE
jgi:hypothetical protein